MALYGKTKERDRCPRCMTRYEADVVGMDDDPNGIIPFHICRFCGNISQIPVYTDEEAAAVIDLLREMRTDPMNPDGVIYTETRQAGLMIRVKCDNNARSENPVRYDE